MIIFASADDNWVISWWSGIIMILSYLNVLKTIATTDKLESWSLLQENKLTLERKKLLMSNLCAIRSLSDQGPTRHAARLRTTNDH